MSNVSHVREEVRKKNDAWTMIADCIEGQEAVKAKGEIYLPKPNAADTSEENKLRYAAYLARAVFYNVTARTLRGLLGQVFSRDSVLTLPESLTLLEKDVEGSGVDLDQQAKRALSDVLALGRAGLLADFPVANGAVTKADQDSGKIRPLLKLYKPQHIINWRTALFGAKTKLCLVVLRETYDKEDDGFEIQEDVQYRVLRLNENEQYTVTLYREVIGEAKDASGKKTTAWVPYGEEIVVQDYSGAPFNEIPFTFIGSENNDSEVDPSPLYDLAVLNLAHYRNSADYEDSVFMVGQPTPWISGLTEQWVKDVLKGGVHLGSRGFLPLPVNSSAGLLQPEPNTLCKEAMDHKERQMVALGAKLVEQKEVQRTATEAGQEEAAESSSLSSAVKNVSTAYTQALRWAARFVAKFTDDAIEYELNSDFDLSNMTNEERAQLIKEWQADAISFTEMRWNLSRAGVAFQTDEEAKEEIESNPAIKIDPLTQAKVDQIESGDTGGASE
jgi:hypothetical protein